MKTSSDRGSMNPVQFAFWAVIVVLIVLAMLFQSCSDSSTARQSTLFRVDISYDVSNTVSTTYAYGISEESIRRMIEDDPHQYYDIEWIVDSINITSIETVNESFWYEPARKLE